MIRLGILLSAIVLVVGVLTLMTGDAYGWTAIVAGIVSLALFCIQPAPRCIQHDVEISVEWLDRLSAVRLRF